MVMDDDEDVVQVATLLLESLGFEVESARDGHAAAAVYQRAIDEGRRFEVVIMDLTIRGGLGGHEALDLLREIDPEVRAIVSSGYSTSAIMSDYRSYGFAGVLAKPYRISELEVVLNTVLQGESSSAEVSSSPGPVR